MDAKLREKVLEQLTPRQIALVEKHLEKRMSVRRLKSGLGIVFDISSICNLSCKGCGTSPEYVRTTTPVDHGNLIPATAQILTVLSKIFDFVSAKGISCFINYGGGEPFLRQDFEEIVQSSARMFGPNGVGIDTNGTIDGEYDRIKEMSPHFSYLGVSLDGLEYYHNWWRGGSFEEGAFSKTISLIEKIMDNSDLSDKLEISSVATKRNITEIPRLMEFLAGIGVKKYSVHRSMPVGRMERIQHLIPSSKEYLRLLVDMVEISDKTGISAHLHHSIESIYATILMGIETYLPDKAGNPDAGSSLGIDPKGNVVFDPWCMCAPWSQLSGGCLFSEGTTFDSIISDDSQAGSILYFAKSYTAPSVRCKGCSLPCSGGNRVSAASESLYKKYKNLKKSDITFSHLLDGFDSIDPACPLYKE